MSNATYHFNGLELSTEVLALLAASYGKKTESVIEQAAKPRAEKASKPSKLAAVKAAKAEEKPAAEETVKAPVTQVVLSRKAQSSLSEGCALPAVGTYSARDFLIAMRKASSRDQQIQAIAGYTGFDRYGDFGSQDLSARMKAQRELRGCKALTTPVHSVRPTLSGYVAGVPNYQARATHNLLAREALAAEERLQHEGSAVSHMQRGDVQNAHWEGQMALLEQARLAAIQADLGIKR